MLFLLELTGTVYYFVVSKTHKDKYGRGLTQANQQVKDQTSLYPLPNLKAICGIQLLGNEVLLQLVMMYLFSVLFTVA